MYQPGRVWLRFVSALLFAKLTPDENAKRSLNVDVIAAGGIATVTSFHPPLVPTQPGFWCT